MNLTKESIKWYKRLLKANLNAQKELEKKLSKLVDEQAELTTKLLELQSEE